MYWLSSDNSDTTGGDCEKEERGMYEKHVSKGHLPYCYLKVRLDFEDDADIDIIIFKHIVIQAVQSLFGEAVSCTPIDVLKYRQTNREAILRVSSSYFTKLWASLTWYSSYNEQSCAFRVLQVSSHLMALAANSRQLSLA
ncbi:hypothetical protein CHS0354_030601 [Potamilus streckersoni]|uniref:Uncharacterized protein n=1 Tax=Potamilus streckersoni TaxID=2493646 RepID=A0AAE0SCF1_9BIVA|nr:hypothetical protein CHS0354_030601 [Potamilus streckersoni]